MRLLSRIALAGGLALASVVFMASARPAVDALVDAVVGTVDATAVSASDIALARALGLFGFTWSEEPIRPADVDRYGAALVGALEASRLGIGPTLAELDRAWTELETQTGGAEALRAWLEATTIDAAWARRALEAHLRWHAAWARRALEAHLRWHTWKTLHEGLTIETPGATPATPGLESDLVARNLLQPHQSIALPFAMPPRPGGITAALASRQVNTLHNRRSPPFGDATRECDVLSGKPSATTSREGFAATSTARRHE